MAPSRIGDDDRDRKNGKNSGNKCKTCSKKVAKGISRDICSTWVNGRCTEVDINEINEDEPWTCLPCAFEDKAERTPI